jgi:hypothetical protein
MPRLRIPEPNPSSLHRAARVVHSDVLAPWKRRSASGIAIRPHRLPEWYPVKPPKPTRRKWVTRLAPAHNRRKQP